MVKVVYRIVQRILSEIFKFNRTNLAQNNSNLFSKSTKLWLPLSKMRFPKKIALRNLLLKLVLWILKTLNNFIHQKLYNNLILMMIIPKLMSRLLSKVIFRHFLNVQFSLRKLFWWWFRGMSSHLLRIRFIWTTQNSSIFI